VNSRKPIEILNQLTADQSTQLLSIFAIEESGLEPPSGGSVIHCSTRNHPHSNASPSLSVLGADEGKGRAISLKCFGVCKCHVNKLSAYLELIGPEGAAAKFWTAPKIRSVMDAFAKGEQPKLGWHDFKEQHGIKTGGASAEGRVITSAKKGKSIQGNAKMGAMYQEYFRDTNPIQQAAEGPMIDKLCQTRGWEPAVVRQVIADELLALRRPERDPSNVAMIFAYRGLYPSPPGIPIRIIKERVLFAGPDESKIRAYHVDSDFPSDPIGDFSGSDASYQKSKRLVFLEGEPDAISWRHFHPNDAIICMGNDGQYQNIIKLLPKLHLKGREVIFCVDRDIKHGKFVKDVDKDYLPVIAAIAKEQPSKISFWMCPEIPKRDSKDVNDFLKAYGKAKLPDEFFHTVYPKQSEKQRGGQLLKQAVEKALGTVLPAPTEPSVEAPAGRDQHALA